MATVANFPRKKERAAPEFSSATRWLGRWRIPLETLIFVITGFTVLRIALLAVFAELGSLSTGELARVHLTGLRFDLLAGLVFVLPQMLHVTFWTDRRAAGWLSRFLLQFEWAIGFSFVLFVLVAEFLFFDEFQSRLNYVAFEYLVYPHEVFGNIFESYPVVPLVLGLLLATGGLLILSRKRLLPVLQVPVPARRRYGLLAAALTAIAGLWTTTGMGSMQVSRDRVANECSGNGWYSFCYYAWTCRFDYDRFYLTIDADEAHRRLRARIAAASDAFVPDSPNPVDRIVRSPRPRRDHNVVIILEESFGSDFVGALGDDRGLTPRFDRLTRDGILFDNFYATGNRTARALEAVLTSMPPIPTEAILKRDHSDRVYTLAHILADRGYRRTFITGGRGIFDGMRSFMMANGFERLIEQSDYENPTFVTAWGVCDEDIFAKALQECDRLHASGDPFFVTVLTGSNHRPFTYPDGRIDRPSSEQKRTNCVKYADWALGEFFEQARSHAFYENTLFVVMGDHGARVYGSQLFPMKSYRIPVLMIPPGGEEGGTRCSTLASSLDIAPTILARLGGSYCSVFFGRDVLGIEPETGYALMQHNHDLALLGADHRILKLGCPMTAAMFHFDPATYQLTPVAAVDRDLHRDAVAFFQTANRLYYDERWFPGGALIFVTAREKFR